MNLSSDAQLTFLNPPPFQQPIDATMFIFLYYKSAERTEMLLFWEYLFYPP